MTDLHRNPAAHPSKQMNIKHPLQPEDIARSVRYVLTQPEHVCIP